MRVTFDNTEITLPDFLIIGAARSGSSSLYFYLRDHPEIFMPEFKEPHFFSYLGKESPHPGNPPWKVEDYTALFRPAKKYEVVGEASASYLYFYDDSINNIKYLYGSEYNNLKIIVTLRNPIERAWSYYMLLRRTGYSKPFYEAIKEFHNKSNVGSFHDFIQSGMYSEQIRAYKDTFRFFQVFLFEYLHQNAYEVMKSIYAFLDLKNIDFIPNNLGKAFNASGIPKSKLFHPLYNFIFKRNKFKEFAKPFLQYSLRQNIKTKIAGLIQKKVEMPSHIRKFLQNTFEPDLKSLMTILDDPAKNRIIETWIESTLKP